MMRRIIISFWVLCLPSLLIAAADEPEVLTLTPDELAKHEFEVEEEEPATVTPLNMGQEYILSSQRQLVKDLMARRLGILRISQTESDLKILQSLIDKNVISQSDIRSWQALGVVFGDILVKQHQLQWVSYEDEYGANKALQWKDTENFVFPVTLFSKRVQFKEDIVMTELYQELSQIIEGFKTYEQRLKLP